MSISADAAVAAILQWVDDGKPMFDDDIDSDNEDTTADDLQDLYGTADDVLVADGNLDEEDNQCVESSDEDEENVEAPSRNKLYQKKTLTSNRLVNSIDACLDPSNFTQTFLPLNTKGTDAEETLVGYLGPKSNVNTPKIHWTTSPPSNTGRRRSCDVIKSSVSTVRYGNVFDDIRGAFSTFITEDMVNLIVENTNVRLGYIMELCAEKIAGSSRYNWIRKTDSTEIYALIGLLYLRGLLGQNNHSRKLLFKDHFSHPLFAAVMSRNRFSLLLSNMMFDTEEERRNTWPFDRLAAIRTLFESFNKNCLKHVIPSEYLAIDETLYPMRNQISFKQYNPQKPAKYGLLFKSLNDARFAYTYSSLVYAGRPEQGDGPYYINTVENYIKKLIETTASKLPLDGRNVSMDRLYTSVSIANWLLERSMTVVGTLMTNRLGIPAEVKTVDNREDLSVTMHFEEEKKDIALLSYNVKTKSKGKKNVLMLATIRPCLGVTKDDGKEKPQIYKLYDFTKGGTDIVDQRISYYTAKAKSVKWKMVAFYYILDSARINAQTMLSLKKKQNPRKTNSLDVGFNLVMALVRPQIERRPRFGLQKSIIQKMNLFVAGDNDDDENSESGLHPKIGDKRKICTSCSNGISGEQYKQKRAALPRNRTQCQKCGVACCPTHLVSVCGKHIS